MMKKILSALVCAAVVLSFAGCGSESPLNSDALNALASNANNTSVVNNSTADVIPEIPVTDAEAFKYEYNADMGGMVITDYLKESPKIRIPDKLEDEPVVGVDLGKCEKQITHLVLPDSVVRLRLSDTTEKSLIYLNLPADGSDYNTAVKYDPDYFGKMTADEYYNVATENAYSDFTAYKSLENIGVSQKSSRYTALDGMLYYDHNGRKLLLVCPQGKSGAVTVPSGTTEIGNGAFYNCEKITSIIIPDSVAKIGENAFKNCQKLTSITIPDSVTEINNNIFDGCLSLANVAYKGKTYDHAHIGELFDTIMYPDMNGGMLIENNTLAKVSENAVMIEIPDTVTEISEDVFNNCTKLEKIKYKNKTYTLSDKKDLIAAIHGEEGLTITSDGILTKVSPELTEVVIPDRVIEIAPAYETPAFLGCDNMKKVTFGKGITEIRGDYFARSDLNVFANQCPNISEIIISEGVTSIGYAAFWQLEGLTNVTIPNSVTSIGHYAFGGCSSLTNVNIPDGVTTIDRGAFSDCTSLTRVTIPDSVTHIGIAEVIYVGAFDGCTNIKAAYKGKTYDYAHIDDLYKAINGN